MAPKAFGAFLKPCSIANEEVCWSAAADQVHREIGLLALPRARGAVSGVPVNLDV